MKCNYSGGWGYTRITTFGRIPVGLELFAGLAEMTKIIVVGRGAAIDTAIM